MSASLRTRAALGAFIIATVLSSCAPLPCSERRHESGLLVVCPEQVKELPDALKSAAAFAGWLAEDHPDAFGYAWPNVDSGELEVRLLNASGEAAVREWIAGNAKRTTFKPADIPRPAVPIKVVSAERSFRQLMDIQHGSVPAKDLPDGDAIWMTGPDARRNATVITIDRLSDALLRALASRYGTSAIVIRVDPARFSGN